MFPKGTKLAHVGFSTGIPRSGFRAHLPTYCAFSKILCFSSVAQNAIVFLAKQRVVLMLSTKASKIWAQTWSPRTSGGPGKAQGSQG